MKWTDNLIIKDVLFKDLKIGDGFKDSDSLYIKISDDHAFDVINNKEDFFSPHYRITPRDCEIIFH